MMEDSGVLPVPPAPPRDVGLRQAMAFTWVGLLAGALVLLLTVMIVATVVMTGGPELFSKHDEALDASNLLAVGRVTSAASSGQHVGSNEAIRYRFTYEVGDGTVRSGVSVGWTHDVTYDAGAKVAVEYAPDDPDVARIEGTRLCTFPTWLWYVVTVVALIAVTVALRSWRTIRARRWLLETGSAVEGRLTHVEVRGSINPTPVILGYSCPDPVTGTEIEARTWLKAKNVAVRRGDAGQPCWVAVDASGTGASALLSVKGWQAWQKASTTR